MKTLRLPFLVLVIVSLFQSLAAAVTPEQAAAIKAANKKAAAKLAAERAAAQGQVPPAQNPAAPAQAAPANNGAQGSFINVQVVNRTGATVQTVRFLPDGSSQRFADIPPGNGPVAWPTRPGMRWVFSVGGQVVQQYTVTNAPQQQITIGTSGNTAGGGTQTPPKQNTNNNSGNASNGAAPNNAQVQAFLQVHNNARSAVGVGPLSWSNELAQYAQQWANHLASLPTSQVQASPHRPTQVGGRGENFAGGTGGSYSPATAAQQWLSEKNGYRYGPFNQSSFSAGHYTQMIWSATTQVGYGMAKSADGWTYVVANYAPGGNIFGQPPY